MSARVVQLFVNPRPRPRARQRIEALCHAFERRGATVIVTESANARLAIDPRADHACSAGGDGTLRYVVDAVRRSGRAISVSAFPAGTVNLLARECGYPSEPDAFVERVLDPAIRDPHFIAFVGETPMLACASVGPDSHVVATVSPMLKRWIGRCAYLVAYGKLLIWWPRAALLVEHDGQRTECDAIYIAKGRYFAGPWSFAPDASVLDPSLHVVTLAQASRWRFFRFGCLLVTKRSVESLAGVRRFRCDTLTVTSAATAPVQADGDIVTWLPATMMVAGCTIDFE